MHDFSAMSGKELANMVRYRICPKISVLSDECDLTEEVLKRLESTEPAEMLNKAEDIAVEEEPEVNLDRLTELIKGTMLILQSLQKIYRHETGRDYKPFL